MSSSYLDMCRPAAWLGTSLLALAYSSLAGAQQNYFIPLLELSSEFHTNRELTPLQDVEDESVAYIASVEAIAGRRSERSQTELRPRVRLQEFPDRDGVDPLEAFVDLSTLYRTLRGEYGLVARFARQDTINSEIGEAGFDGETPTDPDLTDTGIVLAGDTRTSFGLDPSFRYKWSELTGVGANVEFQDVEYDSTGVGARVDFQYAQGRVFMTRQLGPRSEISVGPYISRYETKDDGTTIDGTGAFLEWMREWSEVTRAGVELQAERTETDQAGIAPEDDSRTSWGIAFRGNRQLRAGSLRYSVGRYLAPSSFGSRVERDELRIQYERLLDPRLSLTSALRAGRDKRRGSGSTIADRDLARAEVALKWLLSPQWYTAGGYRFAWQEREGLNGDADDHALFLSFGFRGLDPRR
jgi:hypothetical protein